MVHGVVAAKTVESHRVPALREWLRQWMGITAMRKAANAVKHEGQNGSGYSDAEYDPFSVH